MRISLEDFNDSAYHLTYIAKNQKYDVINAMTPDFKKKLAIALKGLGYKDSDLLTYLTDDNQDRQFKNLTISTDELLSALILIKFNFLFKLSKSFPKKGIKKRFTTKKSIMDINDLITSISSFTDPLSGIKFLTHRKIVSIPDQVADANNRINIYKLVNNYLFMSNDFSYYLKEIFTSTFFTSKLMPQVMKKFEEEATEERTQGATAEHDNLEDVKLLTVTNEVKTIVCTNFLNFLFPPYDEVKNRIKQNASMIKALRRNFSLKSDNNHARNNETQQLNRYSATQELNRYNENTSVKFEIDLFKFFSTYNPEKDYDTIFRGLPENKLGKRHSRHN